MRKQRGRTTLFLILGLVSVLLASALSAGAEDQQTVEIREYEGKKLSPFEKGYITSIKGDQNVDPIQYRLQVEGLVENPQSLTYAEAMALPRARRLVTLHCYDGWKETLLFEGIRLADLFAKADPKRGITTVIFYSVDGYSSSLDYSFVSKRDIILAASVNGLVLDAMRGFPFQVVAEDKYGYKWVRWVSRIELSDKPYKGHTEKMGYSNEADLPESLKSDD